MAWHSIQSGSFDFMFACACDFGLQACPQKSARPKLMDVAMSHPRCAPRQGCGDDCSVRLAVVPFF
jgi:hypothetical protein